MRKSGAVGDGDPAWSACPNNYVSSGDRDDEAGREESKHTALGQKCVKPPAQALSPTFARLLRDPSQRTGSGGARRRDGPSREARRRPCGGHAFGSTLGRDAILYQPAGLLNVQSRMSPVRRKLFPH